MAELAQREQRLPIRMRHRCVYEELNEIVGVNGVPVGIVRANADETPRWATVEGRCERLLFEWHDGFFVW